MEEERESECSLLESVLCAVAIGSLVASTAGGWGRAQFSLRGWPLGV